MNLFPTKFSVKR